MEASIEENLRLLNLETYEILNSAPEESFDQICKLAKSFCDTETAFICFMDTDRLWVKSVVGYEGFTEGPRKNSFCNHVIQEKKPMIVNDASTDPRFKDNPYVLGSPSIRFYAGVPIITQEGFCIGTLSVFDSEKRNPSEKEVTALKLLACQVVELLKLRKAKKHLEEQQELLINKARVQSIGELAGGICHQINNPLAVIVGRSMILRSMLKEQGQDNPEISNELNVIDNTIHRISRILKALRMFAKDLGDDLSSSSFDDLITNALTLLKSRTNSEDIHVDYKLTSDVSTVLNKNLISQVILDVMNNAIDAMENSLVKNLTIEVTEDSRFAYVTISDTGEGVPKEIQDQIFAPFMTTKTQHFGVGLSNAKNFLLQHHGDIILDGSQSQTTFRLSIPKWGQ